MRTTLFSFGYWGWGNATKELVESIDLAERARGFDPPLFVDTRLSRSVRAAGFNGTAFEKALGNDRYRWLNGLGNLGIRDGGPIRIKDPPAANVLLDIALEQATGGRRVLFFCACEKPCQCHRSVVARLVLDAARQRNDAIEVVEWPGGQPVFDVAVTLRRPRFDKVRRGARAIPLPPRIALATAAALPWYSTVLVKPDDQDDAPTWRVLSGPARFERGDAWYLPVHGVIEAEPAAAARAEIARAREADGYAPRRSVGSET
jgi:hypothetical protein